MPWRKARADGSQEEVMIRDPSGRRRRISLLPSLPPSTRYHEPYNTRIGLRQDACMHLFSYVTNEYLECTIKLKQMIQLQPQTEEHAESMHHLYLIQVQWWQEELP